MQDEPQPEVIDGPGTILHRFTACLMPARKALHELSSRSVCTRPKQYLDDPRAGVPGKCGPRFAVEVRA